MRSLWILSLSLTFASSAFAETVTKEIKLFNGKDLTNFYTYLRGHGKNKDPDNVFTVVDGSIRVSGQTFGCFTTEKEFENYRLVTEFKWGQKTWPPREKATRDSGILLHCVGEDGVAGNAWMESIECQMIEGGTGDFILVRGKTVTPKLTCEVEYRVTGDPAKGAKQAYYKPGGEKKEFQGGRINWWGRDPLWKDVLDFRGKEDVENKVGEWNTLECVCDGGTIANILNGKVVNRGTNASHKSGKILFQSEGAELFFRRIDLQPLKN